MSNQQQAPVTTAAANVPKKDEEATDEEAAGDDSIVVIDRRGRRCRVQNTADNPGITRQIWSRCWAVNGYSATTTTGEYVYFDKDAVPEYVRVHLMPMCGNAPLMPLGDSCHRRFLPVVFPCKAEAVAAQQNAAPRLMERVVADAYAHLRERYADVQRLYPEIVPGYNITPSTIVVDTPPADTPDNATGSDTSDMEEVD
jgi:hypothetical protein